MSRTRLELTATLTRGHDPAAPPDYPAGCMDGCVLEALRGRCQTAREMDRASACSEKQLLFAVTSCRRKVGTFRGMHAASARLCVLTNNAKYVMVSRSATGVQ